MLSPKYIFTVILLTMAVSPLTSFADDPCAYEDASFLRSKMVSVSEQKVLKGDKDEDMNHLRSRCLADGYDECVSEREHSYESSGFWIPFIWYSDSYKETKSEVLAIKYKLKSIKQVKKDTCSDLETCKLEAASLNNTKRLDAIEALNGQIQCFQTSAPRTSAAVSKNVQIQQGSEISLPQSRSAAAAN